MLLHSIYIHYIIFLQTCRYFHSQLSQKKSRRCRNPHLKRHISNKLLVFVSINFNFIAFYEYFQRIRYPESCIDILYLCKYIYIYTNNYIWDENSKLYILSPHSQYEVLKTHFCFYHVLLPFPERFISSNLEVYTYNTGNKNSCYGLPPPSISFYGQLYLSMPANRLKIIRWSRSNSQFFI